MDSEATNEDEKMTEADVSRWHPCLTCNKCKQLFSPYGASGWAPMLDEVACPKCGEKKILYYGKDATTEKMILSTYGVNKEINERLERLENQIASLKELVSTSLIDAKNLMTEALISALNERIAQHEQEHHNFGAKFAK